MKTIGVLLGMAVAVLTCARPGALDTSFSSPLSTNHIIHCVEELADGRLLVGGRYILPHSTNAFLVRLDSDGSVDRWFHLKSGTTPGSVDAIQQRIDGTVAVRGKFTRIQGYRTAGIVLLKNNHVVRRYRSEISSASGAFDRRGRFYFTSKFQSETHFWRIDWLDEKGRRTDAPTELSKYCVPFLHATWDGMPVGYIYNVSGHSIQLWAASIPSDNESPWRWSSHDHWRGATPEFIESGPSNSVYLGGSPFVSLSSNGSHRRNVIRLTQRLSLDPGFQFGVDPIFVFAVANDKSNRLVFLGIETDDLNHGGYSRPSGRLRIGRVLENGAPDPYFTMAETGGPDLTFGNYLDPELERLGVRTLNDGRLLVWGRFSTYARQPAIGMARVFND